MDNEEKEVEYYRCSGCNYYWKDGAIYKCPNCHRYLVNETTLEEAKKMGCTFIDWQNKNTDKKELTEWFCASCINGCKRYMAGTSKPVMEGHKCPEGHDYICRYFKTEDYIRPIGMITDEKCETCGCYAYASTDQDHVYCRVCSKSFKRQGF